MLAHRSAPPPTAPRPGERGHLGSFRDGVWPGDCKAGPRGRGWKPFSRSIPVAPGEERVTAGRPSGPGREEKGRRGPRADMGSSLSPRSHGRPAQGCRERGRQSASGGGDPAVSQAGTCSQPAAGPHPGAEGPPEAVGRGHWVRGRRAGARDTPSLFQGAVFAGFSGGVVRVPRANCSVYESCMDCVLARDPHCAWDPESRICRLLPTPAP